MKVKHFAGYGCVDISKVSERKFTTEFGEEKKELRIKVKGNHERGLVRDDDFDAFNWLVKRFDKSVTDYRDITISSIVESYDIENGVYVDVCVYTIIIDLKK